MLKPKSRSNRTGPAPIMRGLFLLARFRREGIDMFDRGMTGVSASLAPLMALPLVLAALSLVQPQIGVPLTAVLAEMLWLIVALLAPIVISHEIARRWRLLDTWPRYAAAIDWCVWLSPVAAMVVGIAVRILSAAGAPAVPLVWAGLGVVLCYLIAVHWFVARHGLGVSKVRAAVMVLATNGGAALLVSVPGLLRALLTGATP